MHFAADGNGWAPATVDNLPFIFDLGLKARFYTDYGSQLMHPKYGFDFFPLFDRSLPVGADTTAESIRAVQHGLQGGTIIDMVITTEAQVITVSLIVLVNNQRRTVSFRSN